MSAKRASGPVTAEEVMVKLQSDPLFVARQHAQEQARLDRAQRIRADEEPLLNELRAAGWDLDSIWDLVNTSKPYPELIPILLKHLVLPYSDVVREGITRSLAVPEPSVHDAWPLLLREYRAAPTGQGIRVPGDTTEYILVAKDGLACALAAAVTEDTLPELITVAKDPTNGESRLLLLSALRKYSPKYPFVQEALDDLANDPVLQEEIRSWRRRKPPAK